MIRRIVYISTADSLDEAVIDAILARAIQFNQVNDVTGFLLYNGRNFLQCIEGEPAVIGALMAQIETDPRHSGVVRLIDEDDLPRTTEGWAMRRVELAARIADRQARLAEQLPELDPAVARLVRGFALLN